MKWKKIKRLLKKYNQGDQKSKKTHKIDESKIVKTDGDVQTKVSERVIATTKNSAICQQADRAYLNNI